MQRREELPPALRRRFRTGRPSLDFTHTGGEGEYAVWEIVHTAGELSRWLALILELDSVRATPRDLPAMRTLRAAITRVARGLAAGARPGAA
ncbi:MAG: ABATE domain-containing protein, partial [Micromonosporaceae bacterium]